MAEAKSVQRKSKPAGAERREGKDTRPQEIVAAAFEEFAAKGFAGTRLEDVAARAKVSKGLPYLYFKTKVELFKAVVRSVITSHFDVIRERMETTELSVEDFLKGPFLAFIQELVGSKRAFIARLLIAEGHKHPELTDFYFETVVSRGIDTLTRLIDRGIESGEFEPTRLRDFPQLLVAPVLTAIIVARAVRAASPPRYQRDARHPYRADGRCHQGTPRPQQEGSASVRVSMSCARCISPDRAVTLMLSGCGDRRRTISPAIWKPISCWSARSKGRVLEPARAGRRQRGEGTTDLHPGERGARGRGRMRRRRASPRRKPASRMPGRQMQRPGEIEVLEASLNQTRAMLQNSKFTLERTEKLFKKGWAAKAAARSGAAIRRSRRGGGRRGRAAYRRGQAPRNDPT